MYLIILSILSRKKNQGELKKMSLSSKAIEDGEGEMSENKNNGCGDEVITCSAGSTAKQLNPIV